MSRAVSALLFFACLALTGCGYSVEPKPFGKWPVRGVGVVHTTLNVVTTDGITVLADVRNVSTEILAGGDGTYVGGVGVKRDRYSYSANKGHLTIYVSSQRQKDSWDAALKALFDKYYTARDVPPPTLHIE